jgi:hypothetical protein
MLPPPGREANASEISNLSDTLAALARVCPKTDLGLDFSGISVKMLLEDQDAFVCESSETRVFDASTQKSSRSNKDAKSV